MRERVSLPYEASRPLRTPSYHPGMIRHSEKATSAAGVFPFVFLMITALFSVLQSRSSEPVRDSVLSATVYNVEQGLAQSTVYQVMQDSRGLIWVATGGGLQCFDGNRFRTFDLPEACITSLSGNRIQAMAEIGPGEMILSSGTSLLHFESRSGRFSRISNELPQFYNLFRVTLLGKPLCWTSSGELWLVGKDRLYPLRMVFGKGNGLPPGFIPDSADADAPGAVCFHSAVGDLVISCKRSRSDTLLSATWKPHGTDSRGPGPSGRSRTFAFVVGTGMQSDTIRPFVKEIFKDRSGNLWIGTDGNGLLFHPAGQVTFDLARIGFTRCLAWFDRSVWVGTFHRGLFRMDPDLRSVIRVNPAVFSDSLYILDLMPDSAGFLWVATDRGLFLLDRRGRVLSRCPFITSSANFLPATGEGLMLSTYDSLYRCSREQNPAVNFLRVQTQVREILRAGDSWWIGNQHGLYRNDASAGVLNALLFREENRLSRIPVYSIVTVGESVWAGTERGIACYSPEGARLELPACMKPLTHEIVYSIAEDSHHAVWFAGNRGIGCIPATRNRIIRFSEGNNIQSLEFNSNAVLNAPSGRIYFGGIKGVNGIRTPDLRQRTAATSVGIFELNISDTAFTSGICHDSMTVRLRWQEPHISGNVFSPDYFPAGSVNFSFFLEGSDRNWSPPSPDNRFAYRNLSPGTYRLFARCTDPFSNQGKTVLLVTVVIPPPFWKTPWFLILTVSLGIVMIIFAVRKIQEIKYRNLLKEMEHRNAIDRERLRISQDMHDEIGSSLTQVVILSEILARRDQDPEERGRIIGRITEISGRVVDEMSDIIWAMNPKNDNLSSFISYLRRHASEYLSTAGIGAVFTIPDEIPPVHMGSGQRRNLYLVVKEALHNVIRHSGATTAELAVSWNGSVLELRIRDNGKGFDQGSLSGIGNGMTTMSSRVESAGGVFRISSEPGKGTTITVSVTVGSHPD